MPSLETKLRYLKHQANRWLFFLMFLMNLISGLKELLFIIIVKYMLQTLFIYIYTSKSKLCYPRLFYKDAYFFMV